MGRVQKRRIIREKRYIYFNTVCFPLNHSSIISYSSEKVRAIIYNYNFIVDIELSVFNTVRLLLQYIGMHTDIYKKSYKLI